MISDEVALILKGQNVASPAIDEVVASLKALRTVVVSTTKSFGSYNDGLLKIIATSRDAAVSVGALTDALRLQATAMADVNVAQRAVSLSSANTVAGTVGRRTVVSEANQIAIRAGGAGLTQSGGFALGGVSGGAGVLGSATIPAVVAAVVGYLGFKSVNVANEFNQSVRDVIASSSQNLSQVPVITQGILNLAGGQNRFTPQQIQAAQYAVQSTPLFANNPKLALTALNTISQQGQPYGAAALPALATADTGAFNAFHLSTQQQFAQVANIIARGVNVGAAEPADFAKGIGTFGASGYAAGLTGTTGLSQLAGAFAQGSILSPRYRFDAQGLNSLLQQVNGKQTAGATSVEANLGISGLFGNGSIGRAGGLPQWLQQLQQATAGPNQQLFLQNIFTRQNALQAVRGLTGQNFGTAQDRIAQVQNYGGTVSAGARIADTGPQAGFDQLRSTFNKDVIEVGNTISGTVNPDLLFLGKAAFAAAGQLGDFLGALGTGIDHMSTWFNLPQKARAVGDSFLNPAVVAGYVGHKIDQASTAVNLPSWVNYAHPTMASARDVSPAGMPSPPDLAHYGQTWNPRTNQWVTNGATAYYHPNLPAPSLQGSIRTGPIFGPNFASQTGPITSTNPYSAGPGGINNRTPGVESIFPLRSLTAQGAGSGPSLFGLGDAATKAQQGIGSLVTGLIKFGDGIVTLNRQSVAAAALLNKTTATNSLTLDRGSLTYDLSIGAPNSVLNAAVAKVKKDLGLSGKSPTEQRNLLEQYSKPVTAIENQRIVNSANTRYGALQDQLTLDKLKNLPTAGDIKTLSDFITTNRKALGLDPVQAQIAVLQLQQQAQTAVVKQAHVQLIRPTDAGAGALVNAGYGASVASLASGNNANSAFAELQKANAALRQQVAYLEKEVSILQGSDQKLGIIAGAVVKTAVAASKDSGPASVLHGLGTARPRPQ